MRAGSVANGDESLVLFKIRLRCSERTPAKNYKVLRIVLAAEIKGGQWNSLKNIKVRIANGLSVHEFQQGAILIL